jgi:ubiquinone/menaquinone biosynthesis C-methylase UbiE
LSENRLGIDYSEIHRIDSPANRALRADIWPEDHDLGQQSFATLDYFDEIIRRMRLQPGMKVLDVGSGTGGPSIYIATQSGCDLTGVEINSVGIEVANKILQDSGREGQVTFVQADGMSMPFPDETFDAAISLNVMNVFEDKVGLFREVRRLLKPGSQWAFLSGTFDFGPEDQDAKDRLAAGYAIPQYTDTLAGYKAKLIEAGFTLDEVVEYISDFRGKVNTWRAGWIKHRDAIAAEQGETQTDHHIVYFTDYLAMIDAGKASNHLIISRRPA